MFTDFDENKHITNQELLGLMSKVKINILDVRELYEYNICHIPGSILIPINKVLIDYSTVLNKEETYYIICHTGQRSYYITDYLTKKGYNVFNIMGGISDNEKYNIPY